MRRKKSPPRVTSADLIAINHQIEKIYDRAVVNMQGEIIGGLKEIIDPLVRVVGALTLLENPRSKK